jgi:beta-lactam-binding protein with PASTA domain
MRDFIWKVQNWLERAWHWSRDFVIRLVPNAEDSAETRSLKLTVFLFIGIIGLMILVGAITFSIAVRGQQETLVPNLQGRDVLDALVDLQLKELYPDIQSQYSSTIERNIVISQRPSPGTLVKAGKRVSLRVSKGPVIDKVENYVGMNLEDVKVHLQTLFATHSPNIIIKEPVLYRNAPGIAPGKVLAQSPAPGTKIASLTALELVVSQDKEAESMIPVDDFVGKSFEEAMGQLAANNVPFAFTVQRPGKGKDPGTVIDQNPPNGGKLAYGQVLQLTITGPAAVAKENVFGLFRFTLPQQPIAVETRLVLISDALPKEILSMRHPGGALSVPYIVPEGSELGLYVLDQEVARQKASPLLF